MNRKQRPPTPESMKPQPTPAFPTLTVAQLYRILSPSLAGSDHRPVMVSYKGQLHSIAAWCNQHALPNDPAALAQDIVVLVAGDPIHPPERNKHDHR